MKIGIDLRILPYEKKEGMAFYSLNFVQNLLKADSVNEYVFFCNLFLKGKRDLLLDISGISNSKIKVFHIPGKVLDFFWSKVKFPAIDSLLPGLDIFHTLTTTSSPPYIYIPPQIKGKQVITVHDVAPLIFSEKVKNVFNIKAYKKGLEDVVKRADAVICISESSKKDLIELSGIPECKTRVIYYGISEDLSKITDPEKIKSTLNKFGIKKKFLLNISRLDYSKNITNLVKAFGIFRKDHDYKLVITGKNGNVTKEVFAEIEKSGVSQDIVYLGYVNRPDLSVLLSSAELFVFPSFYEGFGLPNLEAMKCGLPVVTSSIPVMKELLGEAALLVDPHSPQEIAKAMARGVEDEGLRNDLISRGNERVKLFSWERAVRNTLGVYKEVIHGY